MKKIYIILLNLGYWVFFILLLTVLYLASQVNAVDSPSVRYILLLVTGFILLPSLVSFYSSYFFLFRLFVNKVTKLKLILAFSIVIVATTTLSILAIYALSRSLSELYQVITISMCLNGVNVLVGFIVKSFISWFSDLRIKEELNVKTKMLELEMIKLKLDPHFLFNTINNIDVLIDTSPVKASAYVQKLSSILRFYLYKTSNTEIKLGEELHYINEYIALQKIRTSNTDYIKLTINGNAGSKKVPPMLFIPFIENALKHARNKKEDAVIIDFVIEETEVLFYCKNKINEASVDQSHEKGIGDGLIKNRLKLLYGENYELEINTIDSFYCVELKVPI